MDLDDEAARTGNRSIVSVQQCYVALNTIQTLVVGDDPAVIPAVNHLSWHTALAFSLFTTYHVTSTESWTLNVCPDAGFVIWATSESALTPGVISDSRATVETIKAFEVNRIVYREYFEGGFEGEKWVRLGEGSGKCRRL
jgi:hypothetical protein